jgi:Spx/MgsR family transcriptional regulator
MNIQIIGTKRCSDTRKAERFFKERRIPYHFRDLNEKGLSKGELENICRSVQIEKLINKEGKEFQKSGLQYMVYEIEEELLSDPLLLKTPIVRNEGNATVGYQPETWKNWIKSD